MGLLNFPRFLGFVSNKQIRTVVAIALQTCGGLPSPRTAWKEAQLASNARALLRSRNATDAADGLAEQITKDPELYIDGWSKFLADIKTCVDLARKKHGDLPSPGTAWKEARLASNARALLRSRNATDAANVLAEQITKDPELYIDGWSKFLADIKTCVGLAKKKHGDLPSPGTAWKEARLKSEARALLRNCDVADAANELAKQVEKNPYWYIKGLARIVAATLLEPLTAICARDLGDGWLVDVERCTIRLTELIEERTVTPEEALGQIIADITREPHVYIVPTKSTAKKLAETIFVSIKPFLEAGLPPGVSLRSAQIQSAIEELVLARVPKESLIEKLVERIRQAPFLFLDIPQSLIRGSVDYAQRSSRY